MKPCIQHLKIGSSPLPVEDTVHFLVSLAQESGVSPLLRHLSSNHLNSILKAFCVALNNCTQSVSFEEAALFSLKARAHRRPSTQADLRSYITRMCACKIFSSLPIREISIEQCRRMLWDCFGHSVHAYRKAQSVLHSIFSQALRQQWCDKNPAKAILRPPVTEKRIEILTLSQIRALLYATRRTPSLRCMDSAIRLMIWCGLRPMEVRRLTWADIDPLENMVYVESEKSKTGGARAVPLRGGARLLSRKASTMNPEQHIAPVNWNNRWRQLRAAAGLTTWQNDALRHTFASMHLKRYHNLSLLQEEMGHRNVALLQTRYLNLRHLPKSSAAQFFRADYWK